MNNEECMIVHFVNETKKYDFGFIAFLSSKDKTRIEKIFKDEEIIRVKWPQLDICEANTFKNKFKDAEFCEEPLKILSTGTWTKMKADLKFLMKKGTLPPTKKDRKITADNDTDEYSDDDDDQKKNEVDREEGTDEVNTLTKSSSSDDNSEECESSDNEIDSLPDHPHEEDDTREDIGNPDSNKYHELPSEPDIENLKTENDSLKQEVKG
ncbi:hypothetical protein TKK_0011552 [Trichogramma kaykai]